MIFWQTIAFLLAVAGLSAVQAVPGRVRGPKQAVPARVRSLKGSSSSSSSDEPPVVTPQPNVPSNVQVFIDLDFHPTDTSWRIVNSSGVTVGGRNPGFYTTADSRAREELNLPRGAYTFTVMDAFADGIGADTAIHVSGST